jgi:oligopeptide/dipeptide ABC transporter ATP-binding protein
MTMTIPLLEVVNLRKLYPVKKKGKGFLSFFQNQADFIHAVDGVTLSLEQGAILALVGESGCGKSTLARSLVGLEKPSAGEIRYEGHPINQMNRPDLKALRRKIQMVFQDPYESLNPTHLVGQIVMEALEVHSRELQIPRSRWQALASQALEDAGLKPADAYLNRYPHELSGGQRQRVAIAAALVMEPRLLVADEPVSMLDVSIRAEILNLLLDLRQRRGISILFISHDLGTVACFVEKIAVMYLGRIVEQGLTADILHSPQHPYTQALLSAIPAPNPRERQSRMILEGETPNPINLPGGCRFQPRCPLADARCTQFDPTLTPIKPGHSAACIMLSSP